MKTDTLSRAEQIRAKAEEDIKKMELEETLRALCPVEVTGHITVHKDSVHVSYKDKYPLRMSFAKAYAIYKAWLPLVIEAEDWKGSCRCIHPGEINHTKKDERSEMQGQVHATIHLESGKGFVSHSLKFWAKLGERFVQVTVEMQPEWKWLPQTDFHYDKNGDCINSQVSPSFIGEDSMARWWTSPGGYSLDFMWADVHNFRSFASNYLPEESL